MALQLTFAPSALGDLQAMIAWYEEQGVTDTGKRMAEEIIEAAQSLIDYPRMGRIVPEFDPPNLRELIRPPYRIVYRLDSD